jgi:2-polyprenyl-3-methyl-5-hydroxy-6-metoxy-1,4-benzoquinol methylase
VDPAFEAIYDNAHGDLRRLPWAQLAPRDSLVAWLDALPPAHGARAVVVACGLGDDAEELARRGYRVTAFDVAPTAIRLCHERFPESAVDYQVADLFTLPAAWRQAFDVVVEIHTIQSLPVDRQRAGVDAIARLVAPGGRLFVRVLLRREWEAVPTRPYAVTAYAQAGYEAAGLHAAAHADVASGDDVLFREIAFVRPGTVGRA